MAYTGNLIHHGQCTRAPIHIMVFLNMVYSLSQELVQINNLVNNTVEERFKDHWFCVVENCSRHKNTTMRYLVMYARPIAETWAHL